MSLQLSNQAVCAKCRAMSADMLNAEDYQALSKMTAVREIAAYLTEHTVYSEEFKNVDLQSVNRFALERILNGNLYHTYSRLYKFSLGRMKDFIFTMMQKFEVDILIQIVSELYTKVERNGLFPLQVEILENSKINSPLLLKATRLEDVAISLKGTEYLEAFNASVKNDELNLNLFEVMLYDVYYKNLYNEFEGLSKKGKENAIALLADAHNLARIFRYKFNFNTSPEQIFPYLIDINGELSKKDIAKICNKNGDEFYEYLEKTKLGKEIFRDKEKVPMEQINGYFSKYYRKLFTGSEATVEIPFAFLSLKQLEVTNLIHIIEGVRYSMSAADIMENVVGL